MSVTVAARVGTWEPLAPDAPAELVVVAPHPDDEVLGAAAIMQWCRDLGSRIVVVACTDGESSHARSDEIRPLELRHRRRSERAKALAVLGLEPAVVSLSLPDGQLGHHVPELASALAARTTRAATLLVPWEHDDHPDHQAVATAGAMAANATGAPLWRVPIWGKVRRSPPFEGRCSSLQLSPESRSAKAAAVYAFASQLVPAGPGPFDGPRAARPRAGSHARRQRDAAVVRATPDQYFEEQWADSDDPWDQGSRWYETRKYRLTVAALPAEHYRSGFEPGCGAGFLTELLAPRLDHLVAMERETRGVRESRRRCATLAGVRVEHGRIPLDWPEETFDLLVLSEVLYYLDDSDLSLVLAQVQASLEPGGHVVAVHYRREVDDHARLGDDVHRELRAALGAPVVSHLEDDFVLDVFAH